MSAFKQKTAIPFTALAIAALATFSATSGAHARCANQGTECKIDGGIYHIELPEKDGSAAPVVIFLHGAGGNGAAVLRNRNMVPQLLKRGYAVIGPTGGGRPGSRFKTLWNFYPGFTGMRDDAAFLRAVADDAAKRFGTSRDKVLLAGFSAGAFMVNYLACDNPETFAAYAPVAGGFWKPHPKTCNGPVKLFHSHGWTDRTVPLEGRRLGGGRFVQGDIAYGLDLWRKANGCIEMRPDKNWVDNNFWRRSWNTCKTGGALEFALYPGGHTVPKGWADMVVDWFEKVTEDGGS